MEQKTTMTYPIRGEFNVTGGSFTVDMQGPEGATGTLRAMLFHCDTVPDVALRFRIGDEGDAGKHADWTIQTADLTVNRMVGVAAGASLQGPFKQRTLEADTTIRVRMNETGATQGRGTFMFVVDWDLAQPRPRPQ